MLDESKNSEEKITYENDVTGRSFMEVKLNAENLLKNNFFDRNRTPSNQMKIRLISKKNSNEVNEMIWNDTSSLNSNGYFKGWEFKTKEKKSKLSAFRDTSFFPIIFSVILLILALLIDLANNKFGIFTDSNAKEFINIFSLIILMTGLLYGGVSPIFRSNFNQSANTIKGVLAFNILLEIPIWITAVTTVYNLNNNGLFEIIKIEAALSVVVLYAFVKVGISSLLDIEKLSTKKESTI